MQSIQCVAAANWVGPEKRERKQRVDYNQNRYFNNAMGIQPGRYGVCLTMQQARSCAGHNICDLFIIRSNLGSLWVEY